MVNINHFNRLRACPVKKTIPKEELKEEKKEEKNYPEWLKKLPKEKYYSVPQVQKLTGLSRSVVLNWLEIARQDKLCYRIRSETTNVFCYFFTTSEHKGPFYGRNI